MSVLDLWRYDLNTILTIISEKEYSLSGNDNYDRAIAATILYNQHKLDSNHPMTQLIEDPNFINSMKETKTLKEGMLKLLVMGLDIFDDENISKTLVPYYGGSYPYRVIEATTNGIKIGNRVLKVFGTPNNVKVIGDRIYVTTRVFMDYYFQIFDALSGECIFNLKDGGPMKFFLVGEYIYISFHEFAHKDITVLDLTGKLKGFISTGTLHVEKIFSEDGGETLVVSTNNRNLYVIKGLVITKIISYKDSWNLEIGNKVGDGIISNGVLYMTLISGHVYIVDLVTGLIKRFIHRGSSTHSGLSILLYKNFLLLSDLYSSSITIRDISNNYNVIKSHNMVSGDLVIVNDTLYSVAQTSRETKTVNVYDLTSLPEYFTAIDTFRIDSTCGHYLSFTE